MISGHVTHKKETSENQYISIFFIANAFVAKLFPDQHINFKLQIKCQIDKDIIIKVPQDRF